MFLKPPADSASQAGGIPKAGRDNSLGTLAYDTNVSKVVDLRGQTCKSGVSPDIKRLKTACDTPASTLEKPRRELVRLVELVLLGFESL